MQVGVLFKTYGVLCSVEKVVLAVAGAVPVKAASVNTGRISSRNSFEFNNSYKSFFIRLFKMEIDYSSAKPKSERRNSQFKPNETLPFGQLRSDHIFLMDFKDGEWQNARLVPYAPLPIGPGATILNYGQGGFEGIKAFKHDDDEIYIFRPDQNAQRLNQTAEMLCMPQINVNEQIQAIEALIDFDRWWYPEQEGASLYIRPLILGVSDSLGVHPSKEYLFCIFLSPSGAYYSGGFQPVDLLLTTEFNRAAPGGTGKGKAVGNYGASLRAGRKAEERGAKQALYLDVEDRMLEEAGAMNHYHVTKDGEIIIPKFTDTILESITARSFLELGRKGEPGKTGEPEKLGRLGYEARQESIMVIDFLFGLSSGRIREAGGLGTAAVVSPVGSYISDRGDRIKVGTGEAGPVSRRMYELLTAIQTGKEEAPPGWLRKVGRVG